MTYRGITVGQVGEMKVVEEGVKIELSIEDEFREIPKEGVEARVMFKSAVGEQFVDLLPVADGAPYLEDGDVIPKDQNSIPVSTQELLTTLEAVLRGVPPEALKGAVDSLGVGLAGHGPDIATIIESMAELAELFADRAPEVQGILTNGSRVGDAFVGSREDFEVAIRRLVEVSEELSQDRPAIQRLLENTNTTSEEVVRLLRDYDDNIDRFLPAFAELNDLQAEHSEDLTQLFRFLPDGLGKIVKAFEPETGLIRFGLIDDFSAGACSYGTERRRPSDRSPKLPPKDARCANQAQARSSQAGAQPARQGSETAGSGSQTLETSEAAAALAGAGAPALPDRMSDWSWSLLLLNGI